MPFVLILPLENPTTHVTNVPVKTSALSQLNYWRTHHKRLTEFIVYIAIGLTIAVSIVFVALAGVSEEVILKSFLFLMLTVIAFTLATQESRRYRSQSAFWGLTSTLLFVHSAVWIFLLTRTNQLPSGRSVLVALLVAAVIEPRILRFLLNTFLRPAQHHHLPE